MLGFPCFFFFMKMMNGGGQRGLGSMYTQRPRANITSYTHTHTQDILIYLYLVIYVNGWLGLEGRFTRMSLINSRRRCQTTLLSAWLFLIYAVYIYLCGLLFIYFFFFWGWNKNFRITEPKRRNRDRLSFRHCAYEGPAKRICTTAATNPWPIQIVASPCRHFSLSR